MKMRRFLVAAILSLLFFTMIGYGIGYLIGRSLSMNEGDLEWQNCGNPPGKITQMWLHGGNLYVEMEDKSIYTTWNHWDTCNFYLMEFLYTNNRFTDDWPKNLKEFWVLASSEEASFSKESSSTDYKKNCVYAFQPKDLPPGTISSLTYASCDMNYSVMAQFVLLENGQVMTWKRAASDLMPTDPVTTFPIFFSEVCGSLGLILLLLILVFKVLFGGRKRRKDEIFQS